MAAADQLLSDLINQASERPAAPARQIEKIRYSHDAMIDLILQDPSISQGALAAAFGYTQGWVSIVISSDAFQARLAERKGELVDPAIIASLEERFRAITRRSLDVLVEKLSKPADQVPDALVLKAAELGAKSLGFGQPQAPAAPSAEHLTALASRLIALQRQTRPLEGEFVEVVPNAG